MVEEKTCARGLDSRRTLMVPRYCLGRWREIMV